MRRLQLALLALATVIVGGTLGFWALGATPLDAVYRTVTTITTVGFQQPKPLGTGEKVFMIVLVLVGVGTALYALGALIEMLVEGQLAGVFERRRMEREISRMSGHVVLCGWGRVGRAVADQLARYGVEFVIVDADAQLLSELPYPKVAGDATDDAVLHQAGIDRARALVAAMSNDAANLYVILSGRSLNPDLLIVGRARVTDSEEKFRRAGADRVINPQSIGGSRIAALLLQPHVAEFLDVVTREAGMEFRLEEVHLDKACSLCGSTLGDSHIRSRTGALVLAIRQPDGTFLSNPPPETELTAEQVLILVGTEPQLTELERLVQGEGGRPG